MTPTAEQWTEEQKEEVLALANILSHRLLENYEIVVETQYGYWDNDLGGDNEFASIEAAAESIEDLKNLGGGWQACNFSVRPIGFECNGHSGECAPSCWEV